MATPTRTTPSASKNSPSTGAADDKGTIQKATDAVGETAASLIDAVKARPLASAAIAAGVAGAGAAIWANRELLADQASALGSKASELGGKLGERASALGGKIGDQATALGNKVSETYAAATGGDDSRTQQEIAEEALSLKQGGGSSLDQQSKVGSVSY